MTRAKTKAAAAEITRRAQGLTGEQDIESEFRVWIADWRLILGLGDWRICVTLADPSSDAYASIEAEPKYKSAKISVNAARMLKHKFSSLQVESTAVHELVHAVLWPLANEAANPKLSTDLASYFEELTTEHVAQALLHAKYGNDHPALRSLWSRCQAVGEGG